MAWYLHPRRILRVGAGVREVWSGGGPASVRLRGIEGPEGWLLPSARIDLEVSARDGRTVAIEPELPLPPFATLAYRLGRRAGVPVLRDLDPSSLSGEISIPGLGRD